MISSKPAPWIAEARRLVDGLFEIKPSIYWTDFLLSMTVGYTAAIAFLRLPLGSPSQLLVLPIASLALYRLSLMMHEIVHFRPGEMRGFKVAWNVLAGIPMLMPTFFYESHIHHHNTRSYATHNDGEYLPLARGSVWGVVVFLLQIVLQPILVALRFLILTPISFLHPRLRAWTLERASSFVINFCHRRQIPAHAPRELWAWMEIGCCLRVWAMFVICALGITPWVEVPLLYVLAFTSVGINHLRTLAAHRYRGCGEPMSHEDQLLDSVDITGTPLLTELICPVGTRFHALHHLFPSLPYHNLPEAHRRLSRELPPEAAYHRAVAPSYLAVIRELFYNIRSPQAQAGSLPAPHTRTRAHGSCRESVAARHTHQRRMSLTSRKSAR